METFASVRGLSIDIAKVVDISILLDQRMAPYLFHGDTSVGIDLQHSSNEVLCLRTEAVRHLVLSLLRSGHHYTEVRVIKWKGRGKHGIENDTHAPNIGPVATILPVLQQFRCRIMRTSTGSGKLMSVGLVESSHAKVGNLDLKISGDQYVFRLQVSMADVERVTVRDGANHLAEKIDSHLFTQSALGIDESEEVSLVDVLEDKIAYQVSITSMQGDGE